jgi:hypothetical protein
MSEDIKDGDIVERLPGVYFQWDSSTNSWIRLNGFMSVKVATPVSDGLMPKEDFIKLQRLLTAPPKTTLTSTQCNATFDGGSIQLVSRDFSMFVEDYLDLKGNNIVSREQWQIHEDTYGFNFRVNLNNLVTEMQNRGNLIAETVSGPPGFKGDRGEPGDDKLDTGPIGDKGEPGTNASFEGDLVNATQFNSRESGKAVVDVGVETISQDENYLVIYKGSISPDDLCTRKVNVETGSSGWVIARAGNAIVCTDGCTFKCDDIAHFDMDIIVDSIKTHTESMINQAKEDREQKALEWMRTMISVFNEQKEALCCALENCRSRTRNSTERKFIESQRIAAASAGFKLEISNSGTEIDMDAAKPNCSNITQIIEGSPAGGTGASAQPGDGADLFDKSHTIKWALMMPSVVQRSLKIQADVRFLGQTAQVQQDMWVLIPFYGDTPNEEILNWQWPDLNWVEHNIFMNRSFEMRGNGSTFDSSNPSEEGSGLIFVDKTDEERRILRVDSATYASTFGGFPGISTGAENVNALDNLNDPVSNYQQTGDIYAHPGTIFRLPYTAQHFGVHMDVPNRLRSVENLYIQDTAGISRAKRSYGGPGRILSQEEDFYNNLNLWSIPQNLYVHTNIIQPNGVRPPNIFSFPHGGSMRVTKNDNGLPYVDTSHSYIDDRNVYIPFRHGSGRGNFTAGLASTKALSEFWKSATGDYQSIGNHVDSGVPVFISDVVEVPPLVAALTMHPFTSAGISGVYQNTLEQYVEAHISKNSVFSLCEPNKISSGSMSYARPITTATEDNTYGGCPDFISLDDISLGIDTNAVTLSELQEVEFPVETFTFVTQFGQDSTYYVDPRRTSGGTYDPSFHFGAGTVLGNEDIDTLVLGQMLVAQYNINTQEQYFSMLRNSYFPILTAAKRWMERAEVIPPSSTYNIQWILYSDTTFVSGGSPESDVWRILPVPSCLSDSGILNLDISAESGVIFDSWLSQSVDLRSSSDISYQNGLYTDTWTTTNINSGGSYGYFTVIEDIQIFDDGCNRIETSTPVVSWDASVEHPGFSGGNIYDESTEEYIAISHINNSLVGRYNFVGNHRRSGRPVYKISSSMASTDLITLYGTDAIVGTAEEACV